MYITHPSLNVIISLTPSLNRSHVQKLRTAKTVSTANAAKDTIAEIDIQLVRMGLCITNHSRQKKIRTENGDKYIIP